MISFIIPTLNEKNNIDLTVQKIEKSISEQESYEIIFVDDKSTDGSLEKIKKLSKNNNNINYVIPKKKMGLGNALSLGQKVSKGDYIFFLDCDNSINLQDLIKIKNSKQKNKLVIGSRYLKNSRISGVNFLKVFMSRFLNFILSKYLSISVRDISHSCRIFPKSIYLKTKNLKHQSSFGNILYTVIGKVLILSKFRLNLMKGRVAKQKIHFFH